MFNYPGLVSYAHGCNCAGAMGKGIALDFKVRFPKMYEEYKVRCKNGTFSLGDVFVYSSPPFTVFNLGHESLGIQRLLCQQSIRVFIPCLRLPRARDCRDWDAQNWRWIRWFRFGRC